MKREIQEHYFLQPSALEVRSTREVRCYTARELQQHTLWEMGATPGVFTQKFGARDPLDWIAHQLFHDCIRAKIVNDDVVGLIMRIGMLE
ncbi:hypothetical protein B0O99DRAFT_640405 [Bisporella sp. PMI_857]|nr:hypothetical protein B0O99DRAFT_640405 [Bisporella sp. PMI_857]